MTSTILQTATRVLMPLLLHFEVFLLLRGHNLPGGGFVGGLVVASSFVLYSIAFDVDTARRALLVKPATLLGVGLLVALTSGLPAVITGHECGISHGLWCHQSDQPCEPEMPLGRLTPRRVHRVRPRRSVMPLSGRCVVPEKRSRRLMPSP